MKTLKQQAKGLFSPLFCKREDGNAIDLMSGVLVMVLLFVIILIMIAYGSLVSKRLDIDNTVKEYLYIAEQYGHLCNGSDGLKSEVCKDFCSELEQKLVNEHGCLSASVLPDTTMSQVPYGDKVRVHVVVQFTNPLYEKIGAEEKGQSMFTIAGIQRVIEYSVSYDATSRW